MPQETKTPFKDCTWDERYQSGKDALPWDTGTPALELVEYFSSLKNLPQRVLEIGCGTGTNSIWMAEQGSKVVATDVSATAIDIARTKAKEAQVDVDFQIGDIAATCSVPAASIDLVFDRGVYHVMAPEQRIVFIKHVAAALGKDGHWLCLAGNADELRNPEEPGPPQLKAADLIDNAEGKFELISLERTSFILPDIDRTFLAWKALFKKRAGK